MRAHTVARTMQIFVHCYCYTLFATVLSGATLSSCESQACLACSFSSSLRSELAPADPTVCRRLAQASVRVHRVTMFPRSLLHAEPKLSQMDEDEAPKEQERLHQNAIEISLAAQPPQPKLKPPTEPPSLHKLQEEQLMFRIGSKRE